jgi:low affinity Fe/Cu permease
VSSRIDRITDLLGHPAAVVVALVSVLGWAVAGPFLHFSDRWQVTVQTATAVITFLMIFCVQHTQAKLDELIRVMHPARNQLIGIERANRAEIEEARRAAE